MAVDGPRPFARRPAPDAEFLSFMVGTTRASVTLAAITLQELDYIKYKRGSITIVDRQALMEFACDCYRVQRVNAKNN